ncbi:MAG: hypothetical protein AB8G22_01485 [Saprospiraceae bacterium]
MSTIKQLQQDLSQIIYSITDINALQQIKSTVYDLFPQKNDKTTESPSWMAAQLTLKPLTSFADVVNEQGRKQLTFEELYPYIDDTEEDYTLDDLLAALN